MFLLLGVGALVGHFLRVWWLRVAEEADRSSVVATAPWSEPDFDPETGWSDSTVGGEFDETLLNELALPGLAAPYPDTLPLSSESIGSVSPRIGGNAETSSTADRDSALDADQSAEAIEPHGPELDAARPSVVGITTIHRRGSFDEDRAESYGDADGLPPSSNASSFGTGVLFDPAGLVLTALHVVADPEQILVQVPGVGTREAQLVGADPSTDLAVLRLESRLVPGDSDGTSREHFATATFASEYDVARGDIVFALANAYHFREPLSAGVVEEVVAHIRHVAVPPVHITNEYLKFDAASAPGTSGSPVFDRRGEVVGVLTRSGRAGKDSYALTSRTVRRVLDAMERGGGRVDRGHLGVSVQPVRPEGRLRGLVPEDGIGVLVDEAHPGYPAERSGLQTGDVIVRYEGRTIPNLSTFYEWVTWSEPGSMVELEVVRGDQPIAPVAVQLGTVGDPPGETG